MKSPLTYENPLCAGTDPEAFFPDATQTNENKLAKKICNECEHVADCLEWGLHHEDNGIWGGLTARDRAILRAKKGIVLRQVHLELIPMSVRNSA